MIISWTLFYSNKFLSSLAVVIVNVLLAIHLNARSSLILPVAISVLFLLSRWARITHRNVVSTRNCISHRCYVSLLSITVTYLVLGIVSFSSSATFLMSMMSSVAMLMSAMMSLTSLALMSHIVKLHLFFDLSQSLVEIVFAVTRYVFIYFGFSKCVGRL